MSEKQLSLIIAERAKSRKSGKRIFWNKISKVLNAEGPCVKSAKAWKCVNINNTCVT